MVLLAVLAICPSGPISNVQCLMSKNLIREGGWCCWLCWPFVPAVLSWSPPINNWAPCLRHQQNNPEKNSNSTCTLIMSLSYSNIYLHLPFPSWTLAWLNMKLQMIITLPSFNLVDAISTHTGDRKVQIYFLARRKNISVPLSHKIWPHGDDPSRTSLQFKHSRRNGYGLILSSWPQRKRPTN